MAAKRNSGVFVDKDNTCAHVCLHVHTGTHLRAGAPFSRGTTPLGNSLDEFALSKRIQLMPLMACDIVRRSAKTDQENLEPHKACNAGAARAYLRPDADDHREQ